MSDQQHPQPEQKASVPDGWEAATLRKVILGMDSGVSVNGDETPASTGEKGVLKVSAVSYGVFDAGANKRIVEADLGRAKLNPVAGSIIVSRANTAELVGASAYVSRDYPDVFLPDKLWQITPAQVNADTKWLSFFLAAKHTRELISGRATGTSSGMKNISQDAFLGLPVLLPPLPEQQKIAAILSDWDDSLSILSKLIEAKRQQKRGLAEQLLTGKRRLPGFTGGWEETSLEALVGQKKILLGRGSVISKKDIEATPGDYPIYSSSVKNDGLFGHYGEYMFDEEMITWSIDGGGNFFYRKPHRFSVTNVSGFLKADKKFLDYYWLFSILNYLHAFEQFDYQKKAHPSVILGLYKFNLPSLPEQKAIASVLSTLDSELSSLSSLRSSLLVQKRGLMDLLLTGKVRVNTNDKTQ